MLNYVNLECCKGFKVVSIDNDLQILQTCFNEQRCSGFYSIP